jgi:uncharacterized protein (TIGR02594 family)
VSIRDIQAALQAQGFEPGDIDGVWGRRTIAALRAFQRAKGLDGIGVARRPTLEALGVAVPVPASSPAGVPAASLDGSPLVWFEEAKRLMGLRETPGARSNRVILDWASDLGIDYDSDDIPWCGLFVSHCIAATLPEEPLPNNPLGARNWLKFGERCEPALGAVMVFWRASKQGAKGHVGFYNGEDAAAYHVLGGNQSNGVNITRIGKDRFLGARRPTSVPALSGGPVLRETNGELSNNEA